VFAMLAGVSIALVTGGTAPVTGRYRRTARVHLVVRALLLWMIGVLLIATAVPVYVILPAYALLFVIAIPLLGLPARVLLPLAAVLAVVMPFVQVLLDALPLWDGPLGSELALILGWHYPFTTWIAFIVAGLGIGRLDLRDPRILAALLGIGAALAALAFGLSATSGDDEPWHPAWTAEAHSSGMLEIVGSGGFALGVIAVCLLSARTPVAWIVLPLRAVGSMPLTAYVGQLVAWAILQPAPAAGESTLSAFRALEPFWPFTISTLIACTLWALLVGRGPLEWMLDAATRLIDMIQNVLEEDAAAGSGGGAR
ncbi:MAG: DUF418 domain-containing protein, partial [Actinobacteria bacterium]|nr:DUF418 domain-containing protein [Actinomycetota bacterium]